MIHVKSQVSLKTTKIRMSFVAAVIDKGQSSGISMFFNRYSV